MQQESGQAVTPEVVVITGASAGVGRATARRFARDGAAIGLIARGRDGLEAVRTEVEALGGRAVVVSADVAAADQVEQAAATIEQPLGPIDFWILSLIHVSAPTRRTPMSYA